MILTRIDEAMTPKKRHWETGALVKPEASMVGRQAGVVGEACTDGSFGVDSVAYMAKGPSNIAL